MPVCHVCGYVTRHREAMVLHYSRAKDVAHKLAKFGKTKKAREMNAPKYIVVNGKMYQVSS